MKKCNLWEMLVNRFFILFNLTKPYERPSKDKKVSKAVHSLENEQTSLHTIKASVLPNKETIMTDELAGYTKTKLQIQEVYKGDLVKNQIIEIMEPYYETYYAGRKGMFVYEDYEPLVIGKVYTFSLIGEEVLQIHNVEDIRKTAAISKASQSRQQTARYKGVCYKVS